MAAYFKQRPILPRQVIVEEQEDGSLIIETTTGNMKILTAKILYWIPDISIVEPIEDKQSFVEMMQKYIKG